MIIVACETIDKILVVRPRVPRLDASVAATFRAEILRAVGESTTVVIDMTDVVGMDSTGLGCLVAILKALPPSSEVRLVAVRPMVRKLLELTRLARIFVEYPELSKALAA